MNRWCCFGASVIAISGCGSERIADGVPVASDEEVSGAVVGTWGIAGCRDRAGEPFSSIVGVVKMIKRPDGRYVLVDQAPAYDTLLVTNGFIRGESRIFQLAIKSSSSAPYLREYRLPVTGSGPGRFVVVAKDWDSRPSEDAFVAWYKAPAVLCVLAPVTARTVFSVNQGQGTRGE